ncbi:MAG: hypothetical protein EXS18_03625 [Verrucomicrobiae bacterium]|nr:hypothetical protein [Verrucomicrobiae bacterium]
MKIQPSQREKWLIITAGVVLFVVATLFIGKPLLATWRTTALQYQNKKQELELVHATLAKQPELEKKHQELIKQSNSPNRPSGVPEVLQRVGQIARDAGVTVRSENPQEPRDKGGFVEVAVEYSMEASIETLVSFLYKVRTAQDMLDVTELKVTPTPANALILRVEARVVSLSASGK